MYMYQTECAPVAGGGGGTENLAVSEYNSACL